MQTWRDIGHGLWIEFPGGGKGINRVLQFPAVGVGLTIAVAAPAHFWLYFKKCFIGWRSNIVFVSRLDIAVPAMHP